MKSQSGMTLIEVLAGVAVLSLVSVSLLTWATHMSRAVNNTAQNENLDMVEEHVVTAFGDSDVYCDHILGNVPFDPSVAAGTQIQALDYYDTFGTKLGNLITVGQPVPDTTLTVKDIRLKPFAELSATSEVANLEITLTKANAVGPTDYVKTIPVSLTLQGGNVSHCSVQPTSNVTISDRMCEVQSDGASVYDPVTGSCVDSPKVKYFDGTAAKASCPTGYRVAASPLDWWAPQFTCLMTMPMINPPNRGYTGGYISTEDYEAGERTIDFASNTCSFVYPSGIDTTGLTTKIKCLEE